jgi:hypothetical protein
MLTIKTIRGIPFRRIAGPQFIVMIIREIDGLEVDFLDKDNMPFIMNEIGDSHTLMHWVWEEKDFRQKWTKAWKYYMEQE